MIIQEQMKVVRHAEIAEHIFELTLAGKLVGEISSPGQFVHVRVSETMEPLLRRPISIASIDKESSQMTIIYRAEGRGTKLLSGKLSGETVNVLGPLGNGFPVEETAAGETAVLIGGGIGVPPLYELSKQLTAKGVKCIHILGFQTDAVCFYEEQFKQLGDTYIATVDGSRGTQGFVTDVMAQLHIDFATYYSCGPMPMLKAVQAAYSEKKGFLSFEQRMGCGIGACFACVCHTTEQTGQDYVKVCSDGPVFPAGVVSI
ncbi:dihydroorotate dehydrogenase B (NAD(+)), electron transfer subunit [Sporosarcina sp. NCCP-2222]|uniref:dihydroorotate dehydrogenase electron transfer subunit n=1 Tax=Sporosarcina sp. NCCP-2222 TaxID=2935073 RepID=UPI00208742DF|nr:dihydroorotate dehydrogenase electron transfer subunit [Sporosarcina sp. NCCP-2222]GKV55651.1 dihydroorotate dehydrogenase B (NAD(+)), electron transfer subunit [Sporosarcina sp. NCCP-2222]